MGFSRHSSHKLYCVLAYALLTNVLLAAQRVLTSRFLLQLAACNHHMQLDLELINEMTGAL